MSKPVRRRTDQTDDIFLRRNWPRSCAFLGRIRKMRRQISKLEAQLDNQLMLRSCKTSQLTGMPHSDSPDLQKEQTRTVEIDELKERIAEGLEWIEKWKLEIGEIISKIDDPISQRVLILHFVHDKDWKEAAKEVGYCERNMRRFREKGLTELEEMLRWADEDWNILNKSP